jgi:hypothetical protein
MRQVMIWGQKMRLRHLTAVLLATAAAISWQAAQAADLIVTDPGTVVQDTQLPAVSGLNGKWEFDPGLLDGGGLFHAAGSVSAPLGDRFGIQGDVVGAYSSAHGPVGGGALHVFTRDPSSYLAGITGGVVVSQNAKLGALGAEGELYLDRVSIEGWAGVAGLDFVDPVLADKVGFFGIGDVAFYPTDDFRLQLGGSDVLGDLSVHGGAEYLFHDLGAPVSLTADVRVHTNGSYAATIGLKGYFGGNDDGKTLIDRQRQDDPPNRSLDLFTAVGSQLYAKTTATQSADPETACLAAIPPDSEHIWVWNGSSCDLEAVTS